jgi:hypothetical protein
MHMLIRLQHPCCTSYAPPPPSPAISPFTDGLRYSAYATYANVLLCSTGRSNGSLLLLLQLSCSGVFYEKEDSKFRSRPHDTLSLLSCVSLFKMRTNYLLVDISRNLRISFYSSSEVKNIFRRCLQYSQIFTTDRYNEHH